MDEQLPVLPQDVVHVWHFSLERSDADLERLRQTLTPEEQHRADRFHFEKDRRHFAAGRGLLRTILGRYLGRPPAELRFSYSLHGKPALADETGVRFNLTHSHGLALLAVARGREVGVDVEQLRARVQMEQLAARFFAPAEVAVLLALPAEQREEGFFRCWTRKEAYIKALSRGLSLPLDSFEVSLRPDEPARLLATHHDPADAARWHMMHLDPQEGFVGAVVAAGHDWRLWCGQWPAG
jgi:4'-phosphopantetheinyl transferase